MELRQCGRCHSKILPEYFSRNRQGELRKCCDRCLTKKHQCPKCDYKCSAKCTLKAHIKQVHDKIKDVECPTCDYKCSTKSTLKAHAKICTGELNCSSGELGVMTALDALGHDYVYDQSYDNVRDKSHLRWDFRLEINGQVNMIEYDGGFHYRVIRKGNMTMEEAQIAHTNTVRRDKIKDDYCEKKNIPLLRIPYWEKQNTFQLIDAWLTEFI